MWVASLFVLYHLRKNGNYLLLFKSVNKEISEIEMRYSIVIALGYKRCHWDDIFWVIVLDVSQKSKLPLTRRFVSNDVRNLNIRSVTIALFADKVNFSSLQLSDIDFVARPAELIINDVLNYFFYIALTLTTGNGISYW